MSYLVRLVFIVETEPNRTVNRPRNYSLIVFFNNHWEYIEKAMKPIAKVKYKDMTKRKEKNRLRKKKKTDLIQ